MGDMADLITDLYDDRDFTPRSKPTCRYCGTPGLTWRELVAGWRLFSGDRLHICPIERKKTGGKTVRKFETFWILWQPDHDSPPVVRFTTKKEAQEAAEVMTLRHKVEFYVMRADAVCQISAPPIKWANAKEKSR